MTRESPAGSGRWRRHLRPLPDAALTAAAIPLGLAWLVDHAIQAVSGVAIVNGVIAPATPAATQVLIWVPGWALAVAAALVAAAGAQRNTPVGPLRAIDAVLRRVPRLTTWFLPYAIFAIACSMVALASPQVDDMLDLAIAIGAVLVTAVFAIRRWPKMMVLPTAILTDERPVATARALTRDRLSPGLLGLLVAPTVVPLVVGTIGNAVAAGSARAAAPFVAGTTSGASLLVLTVLVAAQASSLARWYLAPRTYPQPGRVADLAAADAALAGFAASSPRRVRGAWLATLVIPAVLLATTAASDPTNVPVLHVTQVADAPRALGMDIGGRAVLVSAHTITRCMDTTCESVSETQLPGPFDAASVAADGRVVTVRVPGLSHWGASAELTECAVDGRCTRQTLDLADESTDVVSAAVAGLPAGGALVVIFHGQPDVLGAQNTPPIRAWACVPGCRAVRVDIPVGARSSSQWGLTIGHDHRGAPVLAWVNSNWSDGHVVRAACASPDCEGLLVQVLAATWEMKPYPFNVAGLGVDGRGDVVFAGGQSVRSGRSTADYCPIVCWELPRIEPPVLAFAACTDRNCYSMAPERPWMPASRSRMGGVLISITADGRPAVVLTDASGRSGSLVTCIDRCA